MAEAITYKEANSIKEFLILHKFNSEELYEEMFDHIATGYENNPNTEKNITDHLNAFFYSCGSELGLKKIRKEKAWAYSNIYRALYFKELKSYLRWPVSLYVAAAFAIIYFLNLYLGEILIAAIVPILMFALALTAHIRIQLNYRASCKALKRPYKASLANTCAFQWALIPMLMLNVLNISRDALTPNNQHLTTLISALVVTYIIISEIVALNITFSNCKQKPAL